MADPDRGHQGGPLSGLRVVELGSFIAGPFAGQLLGDYGADVIKVEPPEPATRCGAGAITARRRQPVVAGDRAQQAVGGASTCATPAGADLVRRLRRQLRRRLENFRPGRLAEWGLGYDQLARSIPA